jgi:hypothetical protein
MIVRAAAAKLEGQHVGPFIISPTDRWTGRLSQGVSSSAVFVIHNDGPQPRHLTGVVTEGLFTAKLETVEEGKRWMVTASSSARLKPGAYADTIRVTTDSREFPELRMQLEATVEPAVVALPSSLDFGVLPISNPDYDVSRAGKFIFIRQAHGGGLEIRKVSSTLPFVKTEVQDDVKGQSYRMLITFDRDKLTAGEHSGKIILELNNPETPRVEISVKLKAQ